VGVLEATGGYPAYNAGVKKGMLRVGIDEKRINDPADFHECMQNTSPGQQVNLSLTWNGSPMHIPVELTKSPYPDASNGYLGMMTVNTPGGIMAAEFPAEAYLMFLKGTPHRLLFSGGAASLLELLRIFSSPFVSFTVGGFNTFSHPLTYFYQPVEWANALDDGVFWIANAVFWLAWINLVAGLFNCLPAIPLDGGHVFREVARYLAKPFTSDRERQEQLATTIVNYLAALIFLSILFTVTLPYVVHGI
jgi:membrane-associated protease RseP (regulator of RpoE activity)